jgi:uncharacterized protein YndB with AHSA1/START domain
VRGKGRFLEVDPPHLLAYAVDADPAMHMPETTIRVEFAAVDGGTAVTLTHRGLPGDEMCGIVKGGWTGGMQLLEQLLAQQQQQQQQQRGSDA